MSANLDLVRSIYAGWERGDWSSVGWADPEIEFVLGDWPDAGTWYGLAGMAEGMREFLRAWGDFYIEADEYRDLDGDSVVVLFHVFGRGKTSGLELGQFQPRGANVFHFRDGKVTRLVAYFDRERALADLGLAPEGG
jgi:ketosteroid isomerase-like protein